MEKMINLKDLLVHEVHDLYSAEEQIIEALPAMIEKANNKQLKKALQDHLKITEEQKNRLDEVKRRLIGEEASENGGGRGKGLFSKMFGGGPQKCKGVEGLIEEGKKMMGEDMTPEVLDAAIIASAQKIEHYEICGYGTARAYARELNLGDVAELLEETLDEEYEADDLLTDLAVGRLNEEAQNAQDDEEGENEGRGRSRTKKSTARSSAGGNGKSSSKSNSGSKSTGGSKSNSSAARSGSSRSNGSGRSKSAASKSSSANRSKSSSKSASKSTSKSGSKSKSASGKSRSSRASSR